MNDIEININTIIALISAILSSCVLNTILTNILYKSKLKKELINDGNNSIAKKILDSLEHVRNVELKLREQDIFDFDNTIKEKGILIDFFNGEAFYLSIFSNKDTLSDFLTKIQECRREREQYLTNKIALNLSFMENYLLKLITFLGYHGGEKYLHFWGAIFFIDFRKWQKKMDKMIVKNINEHNFELEYHDTKKWQKMKKKEVTKQYENTLLYCMCEKYKSKEKENKKEMINNLYKLYLSENK